MKFKYIWKWNTNFSFKWEKIEVKENEIIDIKSDDAFSLYLSRNSFIEIKMEDKIISKK